MKRRIFLLGGYDLEMITIRDLLEQSGEVYFDRKLCWDNACLSAFKDVLEEYGNQEDVLVYGIELRSSSLDTSYVNYRLIDHHNQLDHLPAAILQVAGVLCKPLDRFQQLVAANDSGYIPGLLAMGATEEEIRQIRNKDRAAQGVTEKDEMLAEVAIKTNLEKIGDLIIVKSATSRFSPICDRLFPYNRLFIYTDKEWMYYGKDTEKVVRLFTELQAQKTLFHGGGPNGFVGTPAGVLTNREIEQIKEIIIENILKPS